MELKVKDLVSALEGWSANTDTDPRWVAASELRRLTGWESAVLNLPNKRATPEPSGEAVAYGIREGCDGDLEWMRGLYSRKSAAEFAVNSAKRSRSDSLSKWTYEIVPLFAKRDERKED